MGNAESFPADDEDVKANYKASSFPGSAIVDSLTAPCGNLKDTMAMDDDDDSIHNNDGSSSNKKGISKILNHAEALCIHSPNSDGGDRTGFGSFDDEYEDFRKDTNAVAKAAAPQDFSESDTDENSIAKQAVNSAAAAGSSTPANPTAALFARALVNEVTDNPKTMRPAEMADREKKFLKAQARAKDIAKNKMNPSNKQPSSTTNHTSNAEAAATPKAIGAPGGVGEPTVLGTIAHALTGTTDPLAAAQDKAQEIKASVLPPTSMSENRAQVDGSNDGEPPLGKYTVTIGLSLSRRSNEGHPETVTRQTAFDFNELQDREYKFVSSTDKSGWRAGGGERGGPPSQFTNNNGDEDKEFGLQVKPLGTGQPGTPNGVGHKTEAPDITHIPIIHIDAESQEAVDAIIAALARGEVFIPHMAITPQALSVSGVSPPDLVVRFGTERNEEIPPDEWPNWCLEFMHNQLYEYFQGMGARWMKRPFQITLAKKVRWKTVKHMNRYFASAERAIDAWREKGPQYLDPQLAYIEGGATPEEVSRPHGIYLLRNGVPTNYFAPNFEAPYTTKMTRSLLMNVLGKSWDKKRREWTSEPIPKLITPNMLVSAMCGCGDGGDGGFIANEVTLSNGIDTSAIPKEALIRSKPPAPKSGRPPHPQANQQAQQQQQQQQQQPTLSSPQAQSPSGSDANDADADTDIVSEPVNGATPSHRTNTDRTGTMRSQTVHTILSEEEQQQQGEPTPAANSTATSQSYTQLNVSVSHSDANVNTPVSALRSPKYGAPPTPEEMISTRSSAISNSDRFPISSPSPAAQDNSSEAGGTQPPSVTGTNTTVMHVNLSTQQFMKRELARTVARDEKKEDDPTAIRTLVSDEDWLDEMGKPLPSPAASIALQETRSPNSVDEERPLKKDTYAMSNNNKAATGKLAQKAARIKRSSKDAPDLRINNSGVSLDYSLDSTTMGDQSTFMGDQSTIGGSSLIGGKFATDGSVATAATKGTTREAAAAKKEPAETTTTKKDPVGRSRDDDEASGLSIQESTSSVEVIPTDEELFAVGWAKALDPKSGSFYYFTLDRSKIVWDNPLVPAGGGSLESDSTSLPEGAVVI